MNFWQRLLGRKQTVPEQAASSDRVNTQTVSGQTASQSVSTRRYHNDVPYVLPRDIEEGERLNLQHYLLRYVLKGNHAVSLDKHVKQILDVGSGTGIWGHEMTREFPEARIVGVDLEPPVSVSRSASVTRPPTNYEFVQGNILHGLPFPDHTFDYTHQRMLVLGIPLQAWPGVIAELKRITRIDGWIELLELGGRIQHAGPATTQLLTYTRDFLRMRGIDAFKMETLGEMLTNAGIRHVSQRYLDVPIGTWDKHLGVLLEKDILSTFEAIQPSVCKELSIAAATFQELKAAAPLEWQQNRATYRFTLAYGQV